MTQDKTRDMFRRIRAIPNFLGSAVRRDICQDWTLARDLGSYLVELFADDAYGHLLIAKAHRHLGDPRSAVVALAVCRNLLVFGPPANCGEVHAGAFEIERRVLLPIVEDEEILLDSRKVVYGPR